jgi:hypothetical protein
LGLGFRMASVLPRTRIPFFLRQLRLFQDYVSPILERRKVRSWWRSDQPLRLKPYWYKRATILLWADTINAENFVETGTYLADTTRELNERFKRVITIELSPVLAARAAAEFAGKDNVEVIHGDSTTVLKRVIPTLQGPTVFLLDAMWAGQGTAGENLVTPLMDLEVTSQFKENHVVVISDTTLFNGTGGYPTLESLRASIKKLGYWEMVADNVILAIPAAMIAAGLPHEWTRRDASGLAT